MTDHSGEPEDSGSKKYRDDALSELMTGALAATSMVSMTVPGGDANLPAPPVWSPTPNPPRAEALDGESGTPARIESGPHVATSAEIEIDVDDDMIELDIDPNSTATISVDLPASIDDLDEEAEPAAEISTDSGVVVTTSHAVGAQLTGVHSILPEAQPAVRQETTSATRTIASVAGIAAIGVILISIAVAVWTSDEDRPPAAEAVSPEPQASDAVLIPEPPSSAEPEVNLPEPAPTPAASSSKPDPSPPANAVDDAEQKYASAAKRFDATGTNASLLEMTVAACEWGRGPLARSAFRKLVGSKARSKAVVTCRNLGVDVAAKVDGFTGPELAARAQAAFDAGDVETALDLARRSNRVERNQPALQLIVRAHCQLGQREAANKMLRHIGPRHRPPVIESCKERGIRFDAVH